MMVPAKWWEWEITSKSKSWDGNFKNLLAYRHLFFNLVRKDFLLNYQQTVLGPAWILFQPLLTLVTYVFVFGKLIGVPVGNLPPTLFYFSGIILWSFFNDSFNLTSRTFRDNIHLFSKVYFPRIIIPLSVISTQLFRLFIQLVLLAFVILYYIYFKDFHVTYTKMLLGFPLAVLLVAMFSLSIGLIFSVLTAKYRDLSNVVDLCVRLLIFITPVFYPLSAVKPSLRWVVSLNPLTPLFELFRLSLLGSGVVSFSKLAYSAVIIMLAFITAILLFNKQGSKLIDVV